jgi:hypothetical protein
MPKFQLKPDETGALVAFINKNPTRQARATAR